MWLSNVNVVFINLQCCISVPRNAVPNTFLPYVGGLVNDGIIWLATGVRAAHVEITLQQVISYIVLIDCRYQFVTH